MGGALFDAGGATGGPGRYAALCLGPVEVLSLGLPAARDPFEALAALAARGRRWAHSPGPRPHVACLLGYDLGRAVERVPSLARAEAHLPDLWAARYDAAWVWDRAIGRGWIAGEDGRARAALLERLRGGMRASEPLAPGPATAEMTAAQYDAALERALAHIGAGDIYQVNLALRFSAPCGGLDPGGLFSRLHAASPVPFAAALRLTEDSAVMSLSPERLLRWSPDGAVETCPIKGTRPRGATPERDAAEREALERSPKDRAEHLMIVDLERNDLGRICAVGSVRVPRLMEVESYADVHHLVSTVRGRLRPAVGLAQMLRAIFPGGSITGAPKVRAMELIEALEPVRRGPYCGAVGYLDAGGGGDLNVAIRTAWVAQGRLYYSAGGGIVADSVVAEEWAEAGWKARGFLGTCAAAH